MVANLSHDPFDQIFRDDITSHEPRVMRRAHEPATLQIDSGCASPRSDHCILFRYEGVYITFKHQAKIHPPQARRRQPRP